jgi:hypothetical protein
VVFEGGGFGDAVGDHGVGAVGEDDGVDVGRRAQFFAGFGDVREDGEGVVGGEEGLQVGGGEGEGVFGEGVFEGLEGYVGEVFVLAWRTWLELAAIFT